MKDSLPFSYQQLHTYHWDIDRPRAVVQIIHGLGEHGGRYESFARFMHQQQVAVRALDLPGFGRSPGKRGYLKGNYEAYQATIKEALRQTRQAYEDIPVFLLGQSMGGNMVLYHGLFSDSGLAGVIATSPWLQLTNPPSSLLIAFARAIVPVFPKFTQPNGLDPNHLSRVPEAVNAYKEDPYVHNRVTAGLAISVLDAAQRVLDYQGKAPSPIFILHGTGDQITSPEGSRAVAENLEGDVTTNFVEGAYHELLHEIERETIQHQIADWILQRI
jgi:alpha-beta hydrolase superfamily lysophospholipase